jgi:hypothetical protein
MRDTPGSSNRRPDAHLREATVLRSALSGVQQTGGAGEGTIPDAEGSPGKTLVTLNTGQFCRLTGLTPRQAQWWDEKAILKPRMNPENSRAWTERDVICAQVILRLRNIFCTQLRRINRPSPAQLAATYIVARQRWNAAGSLRVHLTGVNEPISVIKLLKDARVCCAVIDMRELVNESAKRNPEQY